jgi:hypothetical protein
VLDSSNVLRVKIGKDGQIPQLDLVSTAPTANGSSVTNGNPFVMRLDKDDLIFAPGVWDLELVVMDDSTGAVVTTLKKGIFVLLATAGGSLAT